MMSITQISKSLGISSQAVRQRMSHFDGFLYNHTKMIKHRRYVDDKGVEMIMNSKSSRNNSNKYDNYNYKNGHYIEQLRQDLSYQRKMTDEANNRLDKSQDENKRLTFLLAQSNKKADDLLEYHQQKHGWLYKLFH